MPGPKETARWGIDKVNGQSLLPRVGNLKLKDVGFRRERKDQKFSGKTFHTKGDGYVEHEEMERWLSQCLKYIYIYG